MKQFACIQNNPGSKKSRIRCGGFVFFGAMALVVCIFWTSASAMDWRQGSYNAESWSQGQAPLGFGAVDIRTVIAENRPSYYFRKMFYLPSTTDPAMSNLKITVLSGEGVVVSFNGIEAGRSSWLPAGDLDYDDLSTFTDPSGQQEFDLTGILFDCENSIGQNRRPIAVELHRQHPGSGLSFDAVVSARIQGVWQNLVAEETQWQWFPDIGQPIAPPERIVSGIRYPLTGMPAVTSPGSRFHIIPGPEVDTTGSVFVLEGQRNTMLIKSTISGQETEMGRPLYFDLPDDCVPDTYSLHIFGPSSNGSSSGQPHWMTRQSVAVLPAIDVSVSILHISDSHLPYRGSYYPDTTIGLQQIWNGLPELQPDLVIHTGDGYNEGNFRDQAELFHSYLESCHSPVAYVGGNHELGEWCGSGSSREHYWDFYGWSQLDPRHPDNWDSRTRDYVIDAGPVSFVCLETWTSYSDFWTPYYDYYSPNYDQINWMRAVSEGRPDQFLVACYHHDFDGVLESEVFYYFNFDMGLSGHTHSDEEWSVGQTQLYKVGSTYQAAKPQRWFNFKDGEAQGGGLLMPDPIDITVAPASDAPASIRTVTVRNHEFVSIPGHKTWVPMLSGYSYVVSGELNGSIIGQWPGAGVDWVCIEQDLDARALASFEIRPDETPSSFCHHVVFHVEQPLFRAGETTTVSATFVNECAGNIVQVYIAFEAAGMFFFWPDWSTTPSAQTMYLGPNQSTETQVLSVAWPELPVFGETITFWGVALDNDTGAVVSPLAQTRLIY